MSKIIFLNGCGSSGKTSISKSIQYLSEEFWIAFGVDTFIDMMPLSHNNKKEYFSFEASKNDHGPTMKVKTEPKAKLLFGVMPNFAKLLADAGNNLIIDEVLKILFQ